mmetsp:Transcript_96988/g.278695  ORF Transcript_96988/g.278695 Transcript_96988/m.278695 type:complete len:128 (+) Transcript_96988:1060-1443(+)
MPRMPDAIGEAISDAVARAEVGSGCSPEPKAPPVPGMPEPKLVRGTCAVAAAAIDAAGDDAGPGYHPCDRDGGVGPRLLPMPGAGTKDPTESVDLESMWVTGTCDLRLNGSAVGGSDTPVDMAHRPP